MTSAYFAPLVSLPTIITEPGAYLTRGGERVKVKTVSTKHDFGCIGSYSDGVSEGWHKSGRLFAGVYSDNDIVKKDDGSA